MTWSYTGNPASSTKDRIRFEIGDTNEKSALVSDEEINWAVTMEDKVVGAIARVCEAISMKFSREAAEATGDSAATFMSRAMEWARRARDYRKRAVGARAPVAGGTSKAAKDAALEDDDRVQPTFTSGMMQNEG